MSESNAWTWHVVDPDATESASDQEFETLAQCIIDAREHGYVAWSLAEERRRNPPPQAME